MNKWFVSSNNFVKGPFTADELTKHIQTLGDNILQTFVWSRGYSEWVRADKWSAKDDALNNHIGKNYKNKKIDEEFTTRSNTNSIFGHEKINHEKSEKILKSDVIDNIKNSLTEKFKVQYDFKALGDMTHEELTQFTAKQEDVSKISVYDKKAQLWKDIYAFPEIVNKLGISRRKSPRVPILAQLAGATGHQQKVNARVITISEGGIGLTDCFDLKLGEVVQGQLTSPHFYSPITLSAEVTYAGLDGYVGMKFTQINDEGLALVKEYLNRFGKTESES